MAAGVTESIVPLVTIVLPTFNRATFLPDAFESLAAQTFDDWELIVIDDGSTDDSASVVEACKRTLRQPVTYRSQCNQGASLARTAGVRLARGEYLAFFDSDDLWDARYLAACMRAALSCPEVDWIYTACQVIDHRDQRMLEASTFHPGGQPRAFLELQHRQVGDLNILVDPAVLQCALTYGLHCGFQNSVIHRRIFDAHDPPIFASRIGEDAMTAVRAAAAGAVFGYIDQPLVTYRVHDDNLTAPSASASREKRLAAVSGFTDALISASHQLRDHPMAGPMLRRAAADSLFWKIGYSIHWQEGDRREALRTYVKAISMWPWEWRYYKTCLFAAARTAGQHFLAASRAARD